MSSSSVPKPVVLLLLSAAESFLGYGLVQKHITEAPLTIVFLGFSALNISLWLFYKLFIYPFFLSPLRHLPRIKNEWWIIGQGARPFYKPLGSFDLQAMSETPNDGLITYRGLFHSDHVILTDPKAIAEVLVQKSYDFQKPPQARSFLQKFLGNGLIVCEGDEHRFQRKHCMPAFSFRHIKELYPVFWMKSIQLCDRILAEIQDSPSPWKEAANEKAIPGAGPSGELEMNHWANKTTLDIIGLAGLGRDFNSLLGAKSELVETYEEILEPTTEKQILFGLNMVLSPRLVEKLPWKLNERVRVTTGFLRKECLDLVREGRELCKTQGDKQIDILSLLIKSNDFSDEQLVDQLLTFLAAGHETTSSAFSWTCYLLAEHPSIQSRLRTEINTVLPCSPSKDAPPDLSTTLESLNYLNAVCNEVLRFYPTVPVTARFSTVPTTILNTPVPVGTRVMISPWAINRNPHLWGADADVFNPDRWLDAATGKVNNEGGVASNYSNMTFLHGPRSCIGQNFAKAELRALVAAFVTRFEFVMQRPGEYIQPAGVITTKPKGGVHLRLRKLPGW